MGGNSSKVTKSAISVAHSAKSASQTAKVIAESAKSAAQFAKSSAQSANTTSIDSTKFYTQKTTTPNENEPNHHDNVSESPISQTSNSKESETSPLETNQAEPINYNQPHPELQPDLLKIIKTWQPIQSSVNEHELKLRAEGKTKIASLIRYEDEKDMTEIDPENPTRLRIKARPGRLSEDQLMSLYQSHRVDPEKFNVQFLAKFYQLDEQVVATILKYASAPLFTKGQYRAY